MGHAYLSRVKSNIKQNKTDTTWGSSAKFRVPIGGGNGATWQAFSKHIGNQNIFFNTEVCAIDVERKSVTLTNKQKITYEQLLSTRTLTELAQESNVAESKKRLSKRLAKSSVHVVGVGIKGRPPKNLSDKTWIYISDPKIAAHRATVLTNIEKGYAPEGHWSLLFEISETEYKKINKQKITERVIDEAFQEGFFLDKNEIVSTWQHYEEFAYPTPTLDRDEILNELNEFFETKSIYSRGRFGSWKYEIGNQDHSFMQGVEWVNRCLLNEIENTIQNPQEINSRSSS